MHKAILAHSAVPIHSEGQELEIHLKNVSALARSFSEDPFLSAAGALIGMYHDIGKVQTAFQERLNGASVFVDHSTSGGKVMDERLPPPLARVLAPPILGHHGGLPNGSESQRRLSGSLPDEVKAYVEKMNFPKKITPFSLRSKEKNAAVMELYLQIKLLHSMLVDADFLDTEAYFEPDAAAARGKAVSVQSLRGKYDAYLKKLTQNVSPDPKIAEINNLREQIRMACLKAAEGKPGFYSLTVPTGGGKTLASLGFGLAHAIANPSLKRIIYAIPFCSIVEQNAKVFRDVLGEENVLEHHSSVRYDGSNEHQRLATENWNSPIVVTTNVQLFESLFSNKPSRCRKLHNLQNSVIIFDEIQALPDGLLKPCLNILDALVKTGTVTIVMCTATQPQYDDIWEEKPQIKEIIPDPADLFSRMKRNHAEMLGMLDDSSLAEKLREHDQVLCIVNTRARAQNIVNLLGGESAGTYHLSTLMCPEHRTAKLNLIRDRLKKGQICRVISTSLIEAGVDIDLPVVYREAAGLDSIVQAAGRCNRNGKMSDAPVYVFESDGSPAWIRTQGKRVLTEIAPVYADLLSRDALAAYFALRFHAGANLDEKEIMHSILLHQQDLWFPFSDIADAFEMIQSAGEPLFVPYNAAARDLLEQLDRIEKPFSLLKALQPYGVTIYSAQKKELWERGLLKEREGILWLDVAECQAKAVYSDECGLILDAPMPFMDV